LFVPPRFCANSGAGCNQGQLGLGCTGFFKCDIQRARPSLSPFLICDKGSFQTVLVRDSTWARQVAPVRSLVLPVWLTF
jgi:hypothetical protein